MKRFELNISNRVYYTILATWVSVVIGVVILFGSSFLPEKMSIQPDYRTAGIYQAEIESLREGQTELLKIIARNDPDNPVLWKHQNDPGIREILANSKADQ